MFEASELREKVFQPVLHSVVQLIQHQLDQVNEYVDVIFLVGGFGCSSYLYTQIKEAMALDKRVGEITMPPRGELSVVQGAIYHILRPELVSSKLLRHTYGLESALPFEEGIDPESNRIDGVRCKKRFDVIVRKGDRIYINRPIRRTFWVEYPHHTQGKR